ncbi:MAG: hypothetical protein WC975_14765 [Phycisphaerae bacterium]
MIGEWDDYGRRTGSCCKCQKNFAELEPYYATLGETAQGFQRLEFCQGCWTDEFGREAFSFWQARVPKKDEKKKLFVDDAVLVDFFRRLTESGDESKNGFCFVLALILMRKRILKYVSTRQKDGEQEIWIMKLSGEEKEYNIPNPNLDDQQIEQIRTELSTVLAGD